MVKVDGQLLMVGLMATALLIVMIIPSFQLKQIAQQAVEQNQKIIDNSNRNNNNLKKYAEQLTLQNNERTNATQLRNNIRANATLNWTSAVLSDLEEDLDLLIIKHNLTGLDKIVNNGTAVIVNNTTVIPLNPHLPPSGPVESPLGLPHPPTNIR